MEGGGIINLNYYHSNLHRTKEFIRGLGEQQRERNFDTRGYSDERSGA